MGVRVTFLSRFCTAQEDTTEKSYSDPLSSSGAEVGFLHRPARADLLGRSGFEHTAVDHHGKDVRDGEHGVHVVLDEQDGVIANEPAEQLDDANGFLGAHARERLVEQQHLGSGRQRHRDFHLAALAVGKGRKRHPGARFESDLGKRAFRRLRNVAVARRVPEEAHRRWQT